MDVQGLISAGFVLMIYSIIVWLIIIIYFLPQIHGVRGNPSGRRAYRPGLV